MSTTKPKAKTPSRPKTTQSQFQLHLPVLVYTWSDTKGQEYVSVDVLLLSGMDADCIIPKVSVCCNYLELRLKIPDTFFSHERLAVDDESEDVKVSSLVRETNSIKEKFSKRSESYHIWTTQRIKLPLKVQTNFSDKYTAMGFETVVFKGGSLGHAVMTSVDMVADKVAIIRGAVLSPPVRVYMPEAQAPDANSAFSSMNDESL